MSNNLEKWEINMIVSIRYVLSLLSNLYYILIFIIYIRQRTIFTIKKGITLLMTLTLFTLNIFYLLFEFELIEKRNNKLKIEAPTFCIIRTSIRDTLVLINGFHLFVFSFFIYLYGTLSF